MRIFILVALTFIPTALQALEGGELRPEGATAGCQSLEVPAELLSKAESNISSPEILKSLRINTRLLTRYKLRKKNPSSFLHILCEEYKDHRDMLIEKIQQFANIHTVREAPQEYSEDMPLWSQLTAEGYRQLVFLHKNLAYFRGKKASSFSREKITPSALSVCEMRFIFKHYLAKQRTILSFADWMIYEKGLKRFLATSSSCSADERETLVNFRGDGSMRPHLMESSAMETYAYIVARICREDLTEECLNYQKAPFATRLELDKQLFRALFFYDEKYESYFSNAVYPVFLLPDSNHDGAADFIFANEEVSDWKKLYSLPAHNFAFRLIGKYRGSIEDYREKKNTVLSFLNDTLDEKTKDLHHMTTNLWRKEFATREDLGFSEIFDLKTKAGQEKFRKRIEVSLHRHADFYRTFYYLREHSILSGSISPWSSSSYYIHQSHKFTVKGYASDTMRKEKFHWMQIYKIKKDKLYTMQDLKDGKSPRLHKSWIKEPDFGSNRLTSEELALDHLGMPEAQELEALLWLGEVRPTNEMMEIVKSEGNP